MPDPLRAVRDFAVELKRRKVYRVGVAYVVVAAGALQLLDVLLPSTRLPAWSDEFLLALAIVGLPLVLVLAWMFDMTPSGVERTSDAQASDANPGPAVPRGHRAGPADDPSSEAVLDPRVLAVLPFENLSGTETAAPFAAGLHDDLLTELSRIGALTVISRTSVMGYRDTKLSLPRIARELRAGTILEGGVRQSGGRVRLNVQLVDARSDAHLWAERYDRRLSTESIFDIQSELAEKIAHTLEAELAPGDAGARGPTESLEAYRLCARAREHQDQRTRVDLMEAYRLFQAALADDPDYGRAWAGLASTIALIKYYSYSPPADAPDALGAARRAVELAPSSGDAHTAMGIVRSVRKEGPEALSAFDRAMEVTPGDAEAHKWAGWIRVVLGRAESALDYSIRGAELSPRSPPARAFLGVTLLVLGDVEEACAEARRARDLQPAYPLAHFVEALSLYHMGRIAEARTALLELLATVGPSGIPDRANVRALVALTFLHEGNPAPVDELLEQIRVDGEPFSQALVHAARGEDEAAWDGLRQVRDWDSFLVEQVRYLYPEILGRFRSDPRWDQVSRQVDRSWSRGG